MLLCRAQRCIKGHQQLRMHMAVVIWFPCSHACRRQGTGQPRPLVPIWMSVQIPALVQQRYGYFRSHAAQSAALIVPVGVDCRVGVWQYSTLCGGVVSQPYHAWDWPRLLLGGFGANAFLCSWPLLPHCGHSSFAGSTCSLQGHLWCYQSVILIENNLMRDCL